MRSRIAKKLVDWITRFGTGLIEESEHASSSMFAKPAIGFPLRFVIELVAGGFMGEGPVACAVLQDIGRFIAGQRWLEENDRSLVHPGYPIVMDGADDGMLLG